jgi:hypothetical protein
MAHSSRRTNQRPLTPLGRVEPDLDGRDDQTLDIRTFQLRVGGTRDLKGPPPLGR